MKKSDDNEVDDEKTIIDEIIESLHMEEPKIINKDGKNIRNNINANGIVVEEYEILMDGDTDYFIYNKLK